MDDASEPDAHGAPAEPATSPPAPGRSRLRAVRALAAVVALVIAGVATTVVIATRGIAGTPVAEWRMSPLPAGVSEQDMRAACREAGGRAAVRVEFYGDDPDGQMRRAAGPLRRHPLVASMTTETQQQAYVRFTEIFADQPQVLDKVKPEAMPASVRLVPRDGVSIDVLHTELEARHIDGAGVFQRECGRVVK